MEMKRGTLKEGLQHLCSLILVSTVNKDEIAVTLSDLLKVDRAFAAWVNGECLPKGENLFKLEFLLSLVGYSVMKEMEVSSAVASLSAMVATDIYTIDDIVRATQTTEQTVHRWLSGKLDQSNSRKAIIRDLVLRRQERLSSETSIWKAKLTSLGLIANDDKTVQVAGAPSTSPCSVENTHQVMIDSLAGLINAAIPLAQAILSDDFTAEERRLLREATVKGRTNGVFELSNLLSRLCGERARKEIKN